MHLVRDGQKLKNKNVSYILALQSVPTKDGLSSKTVRRIRAVGVRLSESLLHIIKKLSFNCPVGCNYPKVHIWILMKSILTYG